jgi:DNA repair protein RadD
MKYTLRPYQSNVVDKLVADIVNPAPVIACLAQGAGKSLVIAELANRLNVDILVLSPSREITVQNSDKMRTYVPDEEIGIYSASLNSKVIKKYTFATIGSTYKKPKDFEHFKIVIIDECDLLNPRKTGSMFMSFLKKIGTPKVIGFTATPYRLCQEYQRLRNGFILTHTVTKMINRIYGK